MNVRLFPDIIAAAEVKNNLEDILFFSKRTHKNYFKTIKQVYISSEQCVRGQIFYAQRGLGNVFLGYGNQKWTNEDYIQYFNDNPSIYTPLNENLSLYSVKLGEHFATLDNIDTKAESYINSFCLNLLTQENYNLEVLIKFGFIER